jgi:hypothetical protein
MLNKESHKKNYTLISTSQAEDLVINYGYDSKNYAVLIGSWIRKFPTLSRKLMGKRLIYKEKLIQLLETGEITE